MARPPGPGSWMEVAGTGALAWLAAMLAAVGAAVGGSAVAVGGGVGTAVGGMAVGAAQAARSRADAAGKRMIDESECCPDHMILLRKTVLIVSAGRLHLCRGVAGQGPPG